MNKNLPTTDNEKSIQELYSENPNLVTIQKAANALKVSKDTLRRWEAKGKITSIRTTSGYRLYDLKTLSKAAKSKSNAEVSKPEVVSKTIIPPFNQQTPLIPEVKTAAHSFYEFANLNPQIVQLPSHQSNTKFDPVKKVSASKQFSQSSLPQAVSKQGIRFYTVIALLLLTLLGTVSAAYVYLPGVNQSVPAKYIAGLIKKDINSIKPSREVAITQSKSEVLAASSIAKEGKFLQLNLDTNIVGNLAVEGEGVFTENITAPNILYSLNPGTNITITGDPQNPTISTSLALEDATYTTKGIASFSSTFFTVTDGAVTIADGSLTGDQIDDGTVTNSNLANSSITINAGSGLSGGGTVSLGGSITLTASGGSVSGVSTITGTADQVIASASTGDITLSLPQSIGTTSNVEFDSLELTTGLLLNGSTSGTITVAAPATVTSYTLSLPSDDGTNGYVLQTDGSGNTSWVAQSGGASSLQDAYDGGNTIATTTGRNLAFTLSSGLATSTSLTLTNAGTASAFVLNDTNGATNTSIEVQSGGSPTLTITEAGTLATSGNISTSGSGTVTSAGTLTASNGFTMTTGALSLTSTSGSISSTGLSGLTYTLSSGTAAITAPTLNLNTSSTGNTAIGNATGTFSLTSSGLNVSTGGTITGATWNGTAISTQYGGTGQNFSATAQGSLPYFSATGTFSALAPSTAGYVLTTQGAGANPTWTDAGSLTVRWNTIDDPNGNQTLAMADYTTNWNWATADTETAFSATANALTSGTLFNLSSTSTAGTDSGNSFLLDLSRSGTNSNSSHTAYGIRSQVTNTGTTSTNIAGYFSASGATTNYALYAPSGYSYFGDSVGIGSNAPSQTSKLAVVTTGLATTLDVTNNNTGSTAYGARITKSGAATTGVGLYVTSSGATNNYAAIFDAGRVGIGDTTPDSLFDFEGAISGTPSSTGAWLNYTGSTFTDSATSGSGTATTFAANAFGQPTLAATNSNVTTTNAATVYIANAPAAGSNQTITAPLALLVDSGAARFDGHVGIGSGYNNAAVSSTSVLGISEAYTGSSSFRHVNLFGSHAPSSDNSNTQYAFASVLDLHSSATASLTGTVTAGLFQITNSNATQSIGTAFGSWIGTATSSGGAITNNYGLFIDDQTVGSSDYGLRIDAADTQTLWVGGGANGTTASAGIAFGSSRDTNLYRSAADTLKTDDAFTATGLITGSTGLTITGGTASINASGSSSTTIGNTSSDLTLTGNHINASMTLTDTSSGAKNGLSSTISLNPSGSSASQFRANSFSATVSSGNVQDFTDVIRGVYAETRHLGTGSINIATGVFSAGVVLPTAATSFGTITEINAFHALPVSEFASSAITGTVSTARGIYIENSAKANSSWAMTTQVGIDVSAMTSGSSDIGVRIAGADTYSLQLSSTAGTAASGITFGTDTNLYRSAADTLKTDDAFNVNGNLNITSAGAISAATGITSSGTITFSGLSADSGVYTTTGGQLTTTPPSSGTLGYWSRTGTTLSTANSGDDVTLTSVLSTGAKSTYSLDISQANDGTFNNSVGLLSLANSDTGSTAAVANISQAANGVALAIDLNTGGTSSKGISFSGGLTGMMIDASTVLTTSGVQVNLAGHTQTSGSALRITGNASSYGTDFSGSLILVNPTRILATAGATRNESGNYLKIARSNTVNNGTATINMTGSVADLSSNCTQTLGTCNDSSNILSLTQSYASATGSVLAISNSGSAASILLPGTNSAASGLQFGSDGNSVNLYRSANDTLKTDDAFNVNGNLNITSAGAITAATGITSSGTITFSGLSANSGVYTTTGGQLTTTPPSSGTLGYWSRTGTTLSPSSSGDAVTTSGNISTTGSGTGTFAGLLTASAGLTIAANQNFTMSSGTGTFTQTYSGTGNDIHNVSVSANASSGTQEPIQFTVTNNLSGTATFFTGFDVAYTNRSTLSHSDAAMRIFLEDNGVGTDTVNRLLQINNGDTDQLVTDAIQLTSTTNDLITNGINASDAELANAFYAGANFMRFDGTRIFEGSTGTLTFEDTSGNDLATLVDAGSTGNLSITGTTTSASTLTASNGFTQTTGALNLTASSGAISVSGLSSASLSVTSGTLALATATSGDITLTTGAGTGLVNVLTGNLKVGNGSPTLTQDGEDAYIEGTLEVDGASNLAGAATFGSTTTMNGLTYTWPGSQSSGQVLSTNGSGTLSWTDPDSLTVRWNSINDPNGNQSLSMSTYTSTWNWATGTSTNDLFNITSDASANGTGSLVNIQTGASSTLLPLRVRAGSTEALTVNAGGNVGIGTTNATAKLSTTKTSTATSGISQDGVYFTYIANPGSTTSSGTYYDGLVSSAQSTANGIDQSNTNLRGGTLVSTYSGNSTLGSAVGSVAAVYNASNGTVSGSVGLQTALNNTGTGTMTNARGILVSNITNSGGGAITSLNGITINDQSGATNNTNLLIGTTTIPTGTVNYSIYNSSTYDNYFAGVLGINDTTPTEAKALVTRSTSTLTAATSEVGSYNIFTFSPATAPSSTSKFALDSVSAIGGSADTSAVTSYAGYFQVSNSNTDTVGTGANGVGAMGDVYNTSTGKAGSLVALQGRVNNSSTGIITTAEGLQILAATNSGGGTVTTNYGILVGAQTVGTSDYGVRIDAADTQTLWISGNADNTTAAAGIAFGASRDTNLYRSAANILYTDDAFTSGAASITSFSTTNEFAFLGGSDGNVELSDSSDNFTYVDFKNLAAEDYDGRIGYASASDNMNFYIAGSASPTLQVSATTMTFTGTTITASSLATVTTAATLGMTSTTTLNLGTSATINAAATALNIQADGTPDVNIAGGSSATGCTVANASGNLTCTGNITGSGSGTVGFWSRSSTTLSPATANDIVSIATTNTSGADLAITNTGVYTGTGIFNLTANSATTGNIASITGTGLTTGEILNIDATWAPSDGSTNEAIDINITHTPTSLADNFTGLNLQVGDGSALNNTVYGGLVNVNSTGNAAKTMYGFQSGVQSSSTTADTLTSLHAWGSITGAITTGTRSIYGVASPIASTAASTGGTQRLFGGYFSPSSTLSNPGTTDTTTNNIYGVYTSTTLTLASDCTTNCTSNQYGLYVDNGTSDTDGTSAKYGIYINTQSGADTNYALYSAASANSYFAGNLGIGTTAAGGALDISKTYSANQAYGFRNQVTHDTAVSGNYGGIFNTYYSHTTGTTTDGVGLFSQAMYQGTSATSPAMTSIFGAQFRTGIRGTDPSGTITGGNALRISSISNQATGSPSVTFTNQIGIRIENQGSGTGSGGLTITSAAGLAIADTSADTNATNLLIGTATIPSGTFSIYNSSTAANYFAGNVGIGTTAPGALLDVDKDADSTYFRIQRSSQSRLLKMSPSVNATTFGLTAGRQEIETTGDLLIRSGNGGGGGDGDISFYTGSVNTMFLQGASGNVGIGDTSPASALTVGSGDLFQVNSSGAIAAVTGYTQASGAFAFSGGGNFSIDSAAFDVNTSGAISGVTTLTQSGLHTINQGSAIRSIDINDTAASPSTPVIDVNRTNNTGTPAITNAALYINDHSTNYLLGFETGTTDLLTFTGAGQLSLPVSGSGAGIVLGGDTNLYRSAADTLRTDDAFNVGGNFNVTAAGVISGATGLTSSGTINFSGLTASSAVYTDASKNLTSTAPTSGTIGYWSRSSTTLSPATAGDVVLLDNNTAYQMKDTGGVARSLVSLNSSDMQTFGIVGYNATYNGYSIDITSALPSGQTTSSAFDIKSSSDLGSSDELVQFGDSAGDFLTILGGGNVGIGDSSPAAMFTVGSSDAFQINSSGNIANIGGAAHTIANSSGALGIDSATTGAINIGTSANAKTITVGNSTGATALAFTSGTGSQTFTSSVATTSTTSSAFVFTANSLTSGTGAYLNSTSLTTGKLFQLSTGAANTLTSGTLADMRTTSTALTGSTGTGSLLNLDWSPGSSTTATGDLFALNIGTNGTTTGKLFNILDASSSIFSVSETSFTTSLPSNFTAAGDTSIAYDINFTNPTASYIESIAPLYVVAGETFNSSNLNLQTYNFGSVVVDSALTTGTGTKYNFQSTLSDATANANVLYGVYSTVNNSSNTSAGTHSIYGGYFSATSKTTGTTTAIGVYGTASGGDNNFPFYSGVAFPTANTAGLCWDNSGESAIYDCNGTPTDLAENYGTSDSSIEAGDVVAFTGEAQEVLDPREGKVTTKAFVKKSNSQYQNDLIGIVSTNPNQTYGEDGLFSPAENPRPVSLTGRIPVKVSTENGPISAGDYLTSSSTPGVAMKSTQPGVTIGRALSGYNGNGVGKVIVYVKTGFADPNEALANLLIGNNGQLLGSELNLQKITVATTGTFGGLVSADDYKLNADNISRVGVLASLPVDQQNRASVTDALNLLAQAQNSQESRITDLQSKEASTAAALADAKVLGEQALNQTLSLQDSVASTSASIASLSSQIDSLLSGLGLGESSDASEASDSGDLADQLTPPTIMFASDSATLDNLTVNSQATISGQLKAYEGIFQNSLKSLGDTFLGRTNIAGDLSVDGTFSVSEGSKVNALPTLYFQTSALAEAVDFFNGLVTINKDGALAAKEVVAEQFSVKADSSAGQMIIQAGETEIPVLNQLVETDSIIILTSETAGAPALAVSDKVESTGFVVKLGAAHTEDIKVSYLIVGQK